MDGTKMSGVVEPNIIGYHTNSKIKCKNFMDNENYLIWSKDTHWLGDGMYFWDNLSNADYWLSEKKRKEPQIKEWSIVSANIYLNKMLDLTDEKIVEQYNKLWVSYCEKRKLNPGTLFGG